MRRRDKAGGKAVKTQRRKALKRRNKIARRRKPSTADATECIALLTSERDEALEQQAATSEVLKVIGSSPGDLEPVFNTMLANATRICEANIGILFRYEDGAYTAMATLGVTPAYAEYLNRGAIRPGPTTGLGRVASSKQPAHIIDTQAEGAYADREPLRVATAELGGARTLLNVPMLKEGVLVGAIGIYRQEVRAFTDKQIELVTNFAAQAVIAIENARLLSELRESLQQQTATADVLKVISSSPGELEPVFGALLENATRICEARFANLSLYNGETFQNVALHNPPDGYTERGLREVIRPHADSGLAYVVRTKQIAHIDDIRAQPPYREGDPAVVGLADLAGARTLLIVPMLKENTLVGTIAIYRQEVRIFTDKQIELVRNFAAQAVIAIENTRLLNELRELLQQQTATAEVLQVISKSPGQLQPVFQIMLQNAVVICEAKFGTLYRYDGKAFYRSAGHGTPAALNEIQSKVGLFLPESGTLLDRVLQTRKVAQSPDYQAEAALGLSAKYGGARSTTAVPMLKDNELIGVIVIYRQEALPFTDKQIELVQNFAAQGVIAIENARLLNELRSRTHELATSLENLRTTQDRLVQTQKLASLGQLTAGIAHEIKNPLNFVNNFSGVSAELVGELQEALKDSSLNEKRRGEVAELMDTLRSNLDKVVQHGQRADAIVKNMLLHSHQGSGEHRPVAINAIVEESLKLAYHGARAEKQNFNIMVEQSFDPVAGEADIFPQEITRVLLNLISNGVYATRGKTPPDGEIYKPTLTASTKDLGDRVEIRIRDNGIGIQPDVKEKMFNPFFTTKPAGEGTGLGLSISHDIIVKQHGGSIEVDTQPGEFTEVRIILPRTAASS
ncbi:MAG TPA: GAF domain-containing protein [Pseudolabrys sp.]|jgi:signal transduction histidine kinase|nr:GAF domain-containing protein [Pseudolabrys sp.]